MITEEQLKFIKGLKNPVMIAHPHNGEVKLFKKLYPNLSSFCEIKYSSFMALERVVFTDKSNFNWMDGEIFKDLDDLK